VIIFDWDDTLLCSSAINAQQWRQDQVVTFSGDMMTWDLVWLFGFARLWCECLFVSGRTKTVGTSKS